MTKLQEFRKQTEEAKFEAFSLMCKKVVNLEQENEELKTNYKVLSCSVGDFGKLQDELEEEQRKNNGLSDNLTKAKELVQNLLNIITTEVTLNPLYLKLAQEAEQFLKDSEVEKMTEDDFRNVLIMDLIKKIK